MRSLTAASVAFMHEAEIRAAKRSTDAETKRELNEAIVEVVTGRVMLTDWLPVKNFLQNGFKTR